MNAPLPAKTVLNPIEPLTIDDIRISIIGNQETVLIEDFFPLIEGHAKDNKVSVWLTMNEARGLRDWLSKALP